MFNKKLLFVAMLLCSRSFLWGMEKSPEETLEQAFGRCYALYEYASSGIESLYDPLGRATLNNDAVCVEALVQHDRKKFNPNQRDYLGETPIFMAARNYLYSRGEAAPKARATFETLLALGARTDLVNNERQTIEDIRKEFLRINNYENADSHLCYPIVYPELSPYSWPLKFTPRK